ncbi:hypothetical protein BC835DRAFT_1386245 [Cytidiella melzeri]|nr:hypothetical protein BC835DRAFT_1386245 [Cytidiella melzeri]
MKFTSTVSTLFVFAAAIIVSAAPLSQPTRDVWDPKVLYPHAGTVWNSGERHNVTWDLSQKPAQITNPSGFVVLRSAGIETPVVLAHDFLLTDGRVELTVPEVFSRDDFSLVRTSLRLFLNRVCVCRLRRFFFFLLVSSVWRFWQLERRLYDQRHRLLTPKSLRLIIRPDD